MSLLANPLRRVTGHPGLFVRKLTAAERATLGGKADLSPEQFRDALAGIVACDGAEQPVTNLTPDQVAAVYLAAVAHNNLVGPAVRAAFTELMDDTDEMLWHDLAWHFRFYDVEECKAKLGTDGFVRWAAWLQAKAADHLEVTL